MPAEINIKWEGSAPGLQDGRLSLSAFGEPLQHLLKALRRIANNMVSQAVGGTATGRLANAAKQIDIEIAALVRGSSGVESVVTWMPPVGVTHPMFEELPERAAAELFDAIDGERQGIPRNAAARSFLASLPSGISKQTYSLKRDGALVREIAFTAASIVEVATDLPYLAHYAGRVVGVGFETGKSDIRVRTEDGVERILATPAQVEAALMLRSAPVQATVVVAGSSRRLLAIRPADEEFVPPARETAIYEKWGELLQRLAQ